MPYLFKASLKVIVMFNVRHPWPVIDRKKFVSRFLATSSQLKNDFGVPKVIIDYIKIIHTSGQIVIFAAHLDIILKVGVPYLFKASLKVMVMFNVRHPWPMIDRKKFVSCFLATSSQLNNDMVISQKQSIAKLVVK